MSSKLSRRVVAAAVSPGVTAMITAYYGLFNLTKNGCHWNGNYCDCGEVNRGSVYRLKTITEDSHGMWSGSRREIVVAQKGRKASSDHYRLFHLIRDGYPKPCPLSFL